MKKLYKIAASAFLITLFIGSMSAVNAQEMQIKPKESLEDIKKPDPLNEIRTRTSKEEKPKNVKPALPPLDQMQNADQRLGSSPSGAEDFSGHGNKNPKKITQEEINSIKKKFYKEYSNQLVPSSLKNKNFVERIVGGVNADIEDMPWQVWIGGCGGSILSEEWVVTAAHCSPSVGQTIQAGKTRRSDPTVQNRTAVEVIIFPGFTGVTTGKDIALMRVDPPFDLSDPRVGAIAYATPIDEANGLVNPCVVAIVSGWGTTAPGGSSPDHLQSVDVPITSDQLTEEAYVGWNGLQAGWFTVDQLGAGNFGPDGCDGWDGTGGVDACQGDSGGPLVVPNASGTGYILAGITSWGNSCALPAYPGMYARVSAFADWIEENTGIKNNQYPNLIISEIVEGDESGGVPRYVEIHNASTTETYNLDNVKVRLFFNGNESAGGTINIPEGTDLGPSESFVVSKSAFDAAWGEPFDTTEPDLISGTFNANGNDAIQLFDDETGSVIDVYGVVGTDGTGESWEYVNSIVTRNPWVINANSGGFSDASMQDWTIIPYEAIEATPGSHDAAIPEFDPAYAGILGVSEGQSFVGCDGETTVFPQVRIRNNGTQPFSSVELEINNNGSISSFIGTFGSALQPGEVGLIDLPSIEYMIEGDFTYMVSISDPADGNPTNNIGSVVNYSVILFNDAVTITASTTTDDWSDAENYWEVTDQGGNVIATSEPLENGTVNNQDFCVEDGSYTVTLYDTFGDGIFDGGLELKLDDGTVFVIIDGEDPAFDVVCGFFGCDPEPGLRSVSVNFTIPFVPITDMGVEITAPENDSDVVNCELLTNASYTVTNEGTLPITSFEIAYGVGTASESLEFMDLILQPGNSLNLNLSGLEVEEGTNTIIVQVVSANGESDENPDNDEALSEINFILDTDLNNITVEIDTDTWPDETSWNITDTGGVILASGDGDADGYPANDTVSIPVCLPDGDFTFNLFDSFGDGIAEGGGVTLSSEGGLIIGIIQGDSFESESSIEFSLPFSAEIDVALEIVAPEADQELEDCFPSATVTVLVTNTGTSPVTSIDLEYGIGEDLELIELTGLLNPDEFAEVVLPRINIQEGSNTIIAKLVDVNGSGLDGNPDNDEDEVTFNFNLDSETNPLEIALNLDTWPGETSWELEDEEGNIVASGAGYTTSNSTISIPLCLPDGCYTFNLFDSFGDGGPSVDFLVDGAEVGSIAGGNWGSATSGVVCVGDVTYPVSNLTATALSASEIELNWEYGFEADEFQIYRSLTGAQGSYVHVESIPSTETTFLNSGLQSETMYYYSVLAARNGDLSIPTFVSSTTQISLGGAGFFEGFEGAFEPEGWLNLDEDGDGQQWFHYGVAGTAFEGSFSAASASWTGATGPLTPDNWLITPGIEISEGDALQYYIGAQDPDFSAETYSVNISITGTEIGDFTEVFKETLSGGDWHQKEVNLEEYIGETIYIAFRHFDVSDEFYMKLDNVLVGFPGEDPVDDLPPPGNFMATATSAYSIELTWEYENDPDGFELMVSPNGNIGTFELVELLPGTNRSYLYSGLVPETAYYFQLSVKEGEEQSLAAAASATTPGTVGFKFFEGFEGDFEPEGWLNLDEDGDGQQWFHYSAAESAYEGDFSAGSASWTSATGPLTPDNWLITPGIEIGEGDVLQYYIGAQDPDFSAETYSVNISITGTEIDDFTEVFKETLSGDEWHQREVNLEDYIGETIFIAFRHFDVSDEFYMKLDNVAISEPGADVPPPATPSNLTAEAISHEEISISWDHDGTGVEGFVIQISDNELGPWSDHMDIGSGSNSHTMAGFDPETTYHFRVHAYNEGGPSGWSNVATATTPEVPVAGLHTLNSLLSIYPNPTRENSFNITLEGKLQTDVPYEVFVMDNRGVTIAQITIDPLKGQSQQVTLQGVTTGMYLIRIETDAHVAVRKLVIE